MLVLLKGKWYNDEEMIYSLKLFAKRRKVNLTLFMFRSRIFEYKVSGQR